jgi:hypothetical protein
MNHILKHLFDDIHYGVDARYRRIDELENIDDKYLGHTVLQYAIIKNRLQLVETLLQKGANLSIKDYFGRDCLQIACVYARHLIIEKLLQWGANPNTKNKSHQTAVMLICKGIYVSSRENRHKSLRILINHLKQEKQRIYKRIILVIILRKKFAPALIQKIGIYI